MDRWDADGRGKARGRRDAALTDVGTSRRLAWLPLLAWWLPAWALLATLLLTAHPGTGIGPAALVALRLILTAAALSLLVLRLVERLPWPRPIRPGFVALHLAAAFAYGLAWLVLNSVIESLLRRQVLLAAGPGVGPFLVTGAWLYVMVAGVSYAVRATEQAARAEALAARSQLAALRAQLNPHFLFNALHVIVQLIPREPRRAARASEQLAALLRSTTEEDRDLISLAEEWAFVESYLELERLRFGDRLAVTAELSDEARTALVPSFAVQTLVENAVRHGAAPRVAPTAVTVTARVAGGMLTVRVRDDGAGATPAQVAESGGSGLRRLRERLAALHSARARLDIAATPGGGFTATLEIPLETE
jgi:anti-sigma regulatory factor (Ser/Thr protein kinase)